MTLLRTIQEAVAIEDEVLTDIGLRELPVYLRTKTVTGNDDELGIKGAEVITDTAFPAYPKVKSASLGLIAQSNGYINAGDLLMIMPGHWFTEAQLMAAEGVKYNGALWKPIKVDGDPEDSTPIKIKVLIRKMYDV